MRKTLGLIACQRIHRVNHQHLDAGLAMDIQALGLTVPRAIIQHRIQKAFRLARTGTGCNQCIDRQTVTAQTGPGRFLMRMAGKLGLKPVKKAATGKPGPKRQTGLHIRPLHPRRFLIHKALHHAMEHGVGRFKTCRQELFDAALNVAG